MNTVPLANAAALHAVRFALLLTLCFASAACSRDPTASPVVANTSPANPNAPAANATNNVTISPQSQMESGIATAQAGMEAVPDLIRSTARITNDENRTWRVGSVAEGRIVTAEANPGDVVVKNQVLARMHSHDIHESRALYKKAKADLARAKGMEEYALRQRDRAKRLLDLKAGSQVQLEQADTEYRNSQTDVHNADVEVMRTESHLTEVLGIPAEEADLPVAKDGDDNDLIPVLAPSAGVVLQRNVTPGTVVNPASDLFVISDLSHLWAIAEVNEEYLGKLRVGMPVHVSVQAYSGEVFQGRITKLGDVLDPATRTIKVRIDLPNLGGRLKPEMYASVDIELGKAASALMVPAESVQDIRDGSVVFVKTGDSTFQMRPVRTGRTIGSSIEIVSGLIAGETIAVHGTFLLKSELLKALSGA